MLLFLSRIILIAFCPPLLFFLSPKLGKYLLVFLGFMHVSSRPDSSFDLILDGNTGVQYILDTVLVELFDDPKKRFIYVEQAYFTRWWNELHDSTRHLVKGLVSAGNFPIFIIFQIFKYLFVIITPTPSSLLLSSLLSFLT